MAGLYYQQLNPLSEDMPLVNPEPADEQSWVQKALTNNFALLAQQKAVKAAEQEIRRQFAVQRSTSKAYLGVVAGIVRVKALKQALQSAETGLAATHAGFNAGRRTTLDLIIAERVLLGAQRDYARARYDYVLDSLRLKQAVGSLSPRDLALVNVWLTADAADQSLPNNDR